MKKLLSLADAWLGCATWRDLALVKLCLFAAGVLAGLSLPLRKRDRWIAMGATGTAFLAAYIPVMVKFIGVVRRTCCAAGEGEEGQEACREVCSEDFC
jgi:hypothetical protein